MFNRQIKVLYIVILILLFIISLCFGLIIDRPDEPTEAAISTIEPVEIITEPQYTASELETMAIIIYQEHGGNASSDEARIMVGNVVLNRVASPLFPDSIEAVALQTGQFGTLYKTGIRWPERADRPQEAEAVQRAYDCAERVLSGEKLLPENVVWAAQFRQGKGTYEYIDGTYFCY